MGSHISTSFKMVRRSQRVKINKSNVTNQNKTVKKKKPVSKKKPKQKTPAQIEAAKKRAIAREFKLKIQIEMDIHARSESRHDVAKTKLRAYRREALISRQTPTAKSRLDKEWALCKDRTIEKDGYVVTKRTVARYKGPWCVHGALESDVELETWRIFFKPPCYSKLKLLQATVYFPIEYPFASAIIEFVNFRYPFYELDSAIGQMLHNAFLSLQISFDEDEYFYMSNGPNRIQSNVLRNDYRNSGSFPNEIFL